MPDQMHFSPKNLRPTDLIPEATRFAYEVLLARHKIVYENDLRVTPLIARIDGGHPPSIRTKFGCELSEQEVDDGQQVGH